jgi:hypothetical protein
VKKRHHPIPPLPLNNNDNTAGNQNDQLGNPTLPDFDKEISYAHNAEPTTSAPQNILKLSSDNQPSSLVPRNMIAFRPRINSKSTKVFQENQHQAEDRIGNNSHYCNSSSSD